MVMKITRTILIPSLISISLIACVNNSKEREGTQNINTEVEALNHDTTKVKQIKKVFKGLPSPLELTMLFEKEGITYQPEKLHNTVNRKGYVLSTDKALNLGVYGADLSYSGLFGMHEKAVEYFAASQILAEDLGIGKTFQYQFIARLEANAANRDTLLEVISDFFRKNDSYLKDQNQQDISTLILTGGWIEGMYLGTQMTDENSDSEGIRKIITKQSVSLHSLIIMLQNLENMQTLESLIDDIGKLEVYYNRLEELKEQPEGEEKKRRQNLLYLKIKEQVALIRKEIID